MPPKVITNPMASYDSKTPEGVAQMNSWINRNSYRSKTYSSNVVSLETYNNSGFVIIREHRERFNKLRTNLDKINIKHKLVIQIRALAANFQPSIQAIVPVIPNYNCSRPPSNVPEFHLFNGLIRIREIFDDYHSQSTTLYSKNDESSMYCSRSCLVFYLNPTAAIQGMVSAPALPLLELTAVSGDNSMILSKPIIIIPHLVPQFDPYSLAYTSPEAVQKIITDPMVLFPMYKCIKQLNYSSGGFAINSVTSSYTMSNFEGEDENTYDFELCDKVLNVEPEEKFDNIVIYRAAQTEYILIALSPAGLSLCVYKYKSLTGPKKTIDPVNDLLLTVPLLWSDSTKGDLQGVEVVHVGETCVILECIFRDPNDPINKRTRLQWTIDTSGVQVNMQNSKHITLSHMIAMSVLHARQIAFQTFFRRASNEMERKLMDYVDHPISARVMDLYADKIKSNQMKQYMEQMVRETKNEYIQELNKRYPPSCTIALIIKGAIMKSPFTNEKCKMKLARGNPAAIKPMANNEDTISMYSLTHQISSNYLEQNLVPHIIKNGNIILQLNYEGEAGIDAGGLTNDTINNLAHEAVSSFFNILRPITTDTPLLQYHPTPERTRDSGLYVLTPPTAARIHQCRMIGGVLGLYCMTNYRLHFNLSNTLRFLMIYVMKMHNFQQDPTKMYHGETNIPILNEELGVVKAEELDDFGYNDSEVSFSSTTNYDVKESDGADKIQDSISNITQETDTEGEPRSTKETAEDQQEEEEEEFEEEDVNIEYESYETSLSVGEAHPDPDGVIETPELRDARNNIQDYLEMLSVALGSFTLESVEKKTLPSNHGLDLVYINELRYYLKCARATAKSIIDTLPKNRKKKIRKIYKDSKGNIIKRETSNDNKAAHIAASMKIKTQKKKSKNSNVKSGSTESKDDVSNAHPSDEDVAKSRHDFSLSIQNLLNVKSLSSLARYDRQQCSKECIMAFPSRYQFPYNCMNTPSVYYTAINNFSPADALALYYLDAYEECHKKCTMFLHPNLAISGLFEVEAGYVMNAFEDLDKAAIMKEYKEVLGQNGKQVVKSLNNECIFRTQKQLIMRDGEQLYHVAGASSHVYFPLLKKYVNQLKKTRFIPLPDPLDDQERPLIQSEDAPLYAASLAYHKLLGSVYYETAAICDGFRRVVSAMKGVYEIVATLMTPFELAFNLRGTAQDVREICNLKIIHMTDTRILEEVFEVEKMKSITTLYNITMPHAAIHCFWSVFERLTVKERSMLYKFATGSYLPPSNLNADTKVPGLRLKFTSNANMLPIAHTCFNTLEIPNITNVDEMYRRIQYCLGIEEFLIK